MVTLLFLLRQRSETQQRIKIAKDLGGFARKGRARSCRWGEFASDDPRLDLLPIVSRNRPTGVFCPLPLHRLIPVAFVTPAEALLLFCDPTGICHHARF